MTFWPRTEVLVECLYGPFYPHVFQDKSDIRQDHTWHMWSFHLRRILRTSANLYWKVTLPYKRNKSNENNKEKNLNKNESLLYLKQRESRETKQSASKQNDGGIGKKKYFGSSCMLSSFKDFFHSSIFQWWSLNSQRKLF